MPTFTTYNKAQLDALFATKAVDPTNVGHDLIVLAGQSNMVGQNTGIDAVNLDPTDPRVWTYGYAGGFAGQIAVATEPLQHQHYTAPAGVGPGLSFARLYAAAVPGNRRVLLVPAAYDGTALLSGTNRWDSTATGNLFSKSVSAAQAALAAAGANSRVAAILWLQGESDAGATATDYAAGLDALIAAYRAAFGNPTLPFLIAGLSPEAVANAPTGNLTGVIQALANTPARVAYTAFTASPAGMTQGDNLHFTAAAQRIIGTRLAAALQAAKGNTTQPATFVNATEPTVTGTSTVGQTLTVAPPAWNTAPDSVAYQWRRAGAPISGATGTTYTLQAADSGATITAAVTGTKAGFAPVTVTSAAILVGTATGPATIAADTFTRADSTTTLGSTESGAKAWAATAGTWGIASGQAYNAGGTGGALATIDAGTADYTVSVKVNASDSGSGLIARLTDPSNWLMALAPAGGELQLYHNVGGSVSAVAYPGTPIAAGDVVQMACAGGTVTYSVNGTAVGSFADSTTGTRCGFRADSAAARFDNFTVTA